VDVDYSTLTRGVEGGGQERTPDTNQVQNTQFTVQNNSEDDTNHQETEISIELTSQGSVFQTSPDFASQSTSSNGL
jgi:hypothetical protein